MNKHKCYFKRAETSKKILWITCLLFLMTLIAGIICTFQGRDISFFMYSIPSTGGVFAATVSFYLNKAKMENIFRGKEEFLKYKIEMIKNCPEPFKNEVEVELTNMDNTLDNCINVETQEILGEKFNVIS